MNDNSKIWEAAKETMERIESGDMEASDSQIKRLQELLNGYESFIQADFELKRGMVGLCYEKYFYLVKILWNLEELGNSNKWKHTLLKEIKQILYEENDQFKLDTN